MPRDVREIRGRLKVVLLEKNGMLAGGKVLPRCAICYDPIHGGADMHEVVIERCQWLPPDLLYVEENCVLTHPGGKNFGTCHQIAHTYDGYVLASTHLAATVGIEKIARWLLVCKSYSKISGPGMTDEARKFFAALIAGGHSRESVVNAFTRAEWSLE